LNAYNSPANNHFTNFPVTHHHHHHPKPSVIVTACHNLIRHNPLDNPNHKKIAFTSGTLACAEPPLPTINNTSKVQKHIILCSISTNNITGEQQQGEPKKFTYSRASPSIRYPNHKEPKPNKIHVPILVSSPKVDDCE
jgi:hypothetical protein